MIVNVKICNYLICCKEVVIEFLFLNMLFILCFLKLRKYYERGIGKNVRCGGWESIIKCCGFLGIIWFSIYFYFIFLVIIIKFSYLLI